MVVAVLTEVFAELDGRRMRYNVRPSSLTSILVAGGLIHSSKSINPQDIRSMYLKICSPIMANSTSKS